MVTDRALDEYRWVRGIDGETMFLSVIVCTYNPNENNLARTLDAILAQNLGRDEWELLVVDNNSSVPVAERQLVRERKVRVVFEGRQGLSAARECGIRNSRGDVLVFFDDDNVPDSDYLTNVKTILAAPYIGIVSGAIVPEYEKEPPAWFYRFECMLAIRRPHGDRAYLTNIPLFTEYFPIGAGMVVRRKLIEDYYEAIANGSAYISGRKGASLASAEDLDLDYFAISQGYFIGTVGSLKMKHIIPAGRTTPEYLCRLVKASTRSAAEVNRKWKDVFGGNVDATFNMARSRNMLRFLICASLYWMPRFRVRFHYYRTLLSLATQLECCRGVEG
jgi:glycosyltransferase involved in cell wall biosynthesis